MKNTFIILLLFTTICIIRCKSKTENSRNKISAEKADIDNSKVRKYRSTYSKSKVDSLIKAGIINPEDLPDPTPTQKDERKKIIGNYDKIKVVDSTFMMGDDTLHLIAKYYCLKEQSLIIPPIYDVESRSPAEFSTRPFASHITVIRS